MLYFHIIQIRLSEIEISYSSPQTVNNDAATTTQKRNPFLWAEAKARALACIFPWDPEKLNYGYFSNFSFALDI